ncbi:YheV family putative zinc ribbon protein [Aliikangiella sp. G2MR2-5]|uniref:YheV family putative zinc ribbon protein n=1 Tax=Aliikangiella sp. G2MR2-5 TaxID=2788943 RepID=UPI0018AC2058|nr:YheV family putative zinc ribbon protein [Aliikangiella sp. G2MR2-5]
MKPTQRFVAGAVCPQCNEQDALLIDSKDQSIECVDCGYTQSAEQRDTKKDESKQSKVSGAQKHKPENLINIKQIEE